MKQVTIGRLARVVAALAALPALAFAQNGRIGGTVTDGAKNPVAGAQVLVNIAGLSAESGADGKYVVVNVPAGTYSLKVYRLGFKVTSVASVTVTAGATATADISLVPAAVQLGGVVVSASRRVEKITDAPATITHFDAQQIENTIGSSFAPALKEAKGIEFIQTGVTGVAINARGFNSSFNNRMLMLEDSRIAVLVESGLPVGALTTTSKVDLAGVEVLTGPGSALYGPDASNGVLSLTTKDPKQYQGWTLDLSGGNRNFYDAQARWARATKDGKWAYKLTGEYQAVDDFSNIVYYPNPSAGKPPVLENSPDFRNDATRGSFAIARYFDDGGRLMFNAGLSKINGIGATNVGRNQLVNYGYREYQLEYTSPRWFAQTYITNSVGGSTFQLNGYTQNAVRYPNISTDSARKLSAFPGDGRVYAAEVQNNFSIGMLTKTGNSVVDNSHITWGTQLRRDRISTYGHWLSDGQTGVPIVLAQMGEYAQIESPLNDQFRLILSGRYDKHDRYDAQFSPKAGVLWSPVQDQTFRVTWNRAFKSPTVLQTDFYFPNFAPYIGVFGNEDGFTIKNAAGNTVATYNPIKPETNDTWELGYKGVIGNDLYVDLTGYRTNFKDFMSPLVVIANPLAGAAATTAYDTKTGAKITDKAGGPQVALTYFNVGKAQITGLDAGLRYYFTDKISASGNFSLIHVDSIESNPAAPEATAFNSASSRITAGMDFADLVMPKTNSGFTVRYVNGYDFRSGVNRGRIPGFATLDFTANYQIPDTHTALMLQVQNAFACVQGTSTPPVQGISSAYAATYTDGQSCGFGKAHSEMINAPLIGTILQLGVRWSGR
ncbi:MAG: TonB-dependent receptor [Gemmatimonadetes bacterium]|nr:TonB-dependent receptor [Gemmatimonadota bacterium]